jgi:transposase InsO family protein
LLTRTEVAELAGVSERTVARRIKPAEAGPLAPNGKPIPLYDAAALPADAQKRWARSERRKVVEITPTAADGQLALALSAPAGPNLSVEDRAEAERRFEIIEPLVDRDKYYLLWVQHPAVSQMMEYLATAHSKPNKRITVRTIYRWWGQWKKGGYPELVRRDRSDKGMPRVMNDAARALLLKLAVPQKGVYGALRVREMWRVYEEERVWRDAHVTRAMDDYTRDKYAQYLDGDDRLMPAAQLPRVSYETFRVWFNRIPEMLRTMGRDGADAYQTSQEIITHRDYTSMAPMDWVVFDHRVLDIFCLAPRRGGWTLVRPWLTAAMDMRTRKWLAWAIVETPSSDSIATVLKKLFLEHGLPQELYWDNGKDFRCQWFEGRTRKERRSERIAELDTTWRGVLGTLDIRVRHAIPYRARSKNIEPNFNRISSFDRTLPEWCGHQPGARPERFGEMVKQHEAFMAGKAECTPFRTIAEVASLYSRVLRNLNETEMTPGAEGMRKATATGYGWMCPNEAWDLLIDKVDRRTVPVDVLHMCFAKRVELTVRNGELAMTRGGQPHYYRLSDNTLRLQMLNGKTVELAYDPLDLGEAAVYFEGRFFGLVACVTLRRMGEEAFVQDERDRRASRRENKKAIELMTRMAPTVSPEERLARRAEVLPARTDVPRVEIPVAIAAPVEAAAAAVAEEKSFDVEAAPAAAVTAVRPAEPNEDDEFVFFGD